MRRVIQILVLAAAACLAPAVPAYEGTVDPVALVYFDAYVLNSLAAKLEAKGELREAWNNFQKASAIMADIARDHPTWHPGMRARRQQKIQEALLQVQARLAKEEPLEP